MLDTSADLVGSRMLGQDNTYALHRDSLNTLDKGPSGRGHLKGAPPPHHTVSDDAATWVAPLLPTLTIIARACVLDQVA